MRRDELKPESISGPLTHALFKTQAAEDEEYPEDTGDVTVYWGQRLLRPTYELSAGAQELEYELSSVGNNLYGNSAKYIEEGSIVIADQVEGRWYIRGVIQDPPDEDEEDDEE